MSEEPMFLTAIKSVPALVSAAAAVITALVGVVTLGPLVSSDDPPTATTPPTVTVEEPPSPTDEPPPPSTQPEGSPELRYWALPTIEHLYLDAGFTPDPLFLDGAAGGPIDAGMVGCTGYIAEEPDYIVDWYGATEQLSFAFLASNGADTTMAVLDPYGAWWCADDSGDSLDPIVFVPWPGDGEYAIWIGTYVANDYAEGSFVVSELL
ncbi:MAG: hypothetical protein AAGD18_24465 [Actinomycetota bacterium]